MNKVLISKTPIATEVE